MKKTLLIAAIFCTPFAVNAQHSSGKILFNETLKMTAQLESVPEQFKDLIPKEQQFKNVLYFNADASLYESNAATAATNDQDIEQANGNLKMRIKMDVPQDKVFTDIKESKTIAQRTFMSRKFLVSSTTDKSQWKISGKQKTILGYPCQEAICYKQKDTIVAWFTANIPVSAGPMGLGGLPGMILEVQQGNELMIQATSVEFGDASNNKIVKPKDGKKVTKDEYEAIVEAKQKEMQEQYGGNGNVIIKVNR